MATIVKDAESVIEAAKKVIAHIENVRNNEDEKTIAEAMKTTFRFSFRRGFYRMNRQETINWIRSQGAFGNWGFSYYAWGDLDKAKSLLLIAEHGDPVTLNCEDVRVLYGN